MIIFDIDDTLYDEIDFVKSGYSVISKYIEEKYNLKNVFSMLMDLFNESSKNVFNRLFDRLNISYCDSDVMELVNMYRNHRPNIELSCEVIDTLVRLREKYILCVVSDGNYNTQFLKCESLGLYKYFDEIILTDKYGKDFWKPSKKAFDLLSKKYNIELLDMYYVGDNPNKDFYLSKYGIKTVRYYNENGIYYNDDYLEGILEEYRISKFNDILNLVNVNF